MRPHDCGFRVIRIFSSLRSQPWAQFPSKDGIVLHSKRNLISRRMDLEVHIGSTTGRGPLPPVLRRTCVLPSVVYPGGRSAGEGDGTPDGVLGCAEPHLRGSDLGIVYRASKFVWQYDHSTKTKSVYFFFRSSRSFSISLRPWRGTL